MNFFDNLVIPQSEGSLHLLNYMLKLALILFLPYIGFLNGASIYSLIFNIIGRAKNNNDYVRFSKELIDMTFFRKGILLTLGILPLVSIIFSYVQLLHEAKVEVVTNLIIAFFLLAVSLVLIYSYKYTFKLDYLFRNRIHQEEQTKTNDSGEHTSNDTKEFINSNLKAHKVSGGLGTALLIISTYLIIGSIQLSTDTLRWGNASFFDVVFSIKSVVKYLFFISASFAITSGAVLFFYFKWRDKYEHKEINYINFIKDFSLITAILFTLTLPLLLLLNVFFTPKLALTNSFFGFSLLSLIILFILIHFLYIMYKNSITNYISHSFYSLLIVFILFIIGDQVAFGTASKENVVLLASNYDKIHQAMMEKAGNVAEISGQEIFDARCAACHRFEVRLVGPAYNEVLKKYEGKIDQLTGFILNPVKVDPNFPPMPAPGLKPNEASAVADYIMSTYQK